MDSTYQKGGGADINGENDGVQCQQGKEQGLMSPSNRSISIGDYPVARSYKEMLEILKHLNKSCDSMTERVCGLNLKYADVITKAALIIDPEVVKILHGDEEFNANGSQLSQPNEKMSTEELNKKYADMYTALDNDQHLKQQGDNNSMSSEMEDDLINSHPN